jgi:hypothetical protein
LLDSCDGSIHFPFTQQILKKSNIENFVTLKHIVFGYKIFDKDYFDFNYFLAILGFSIYKAYYVSEQKTKV